MNIDVNIGKIRYEFYGLFIVIRRINVCSSADVIKRVSGKSPVLHSTELPYLGVLSANYKRTLKSGLAILGVLSISEAIQQADSFKDKLAML